MLINTKLLNLDNKIDIFQEDNEKLLEEYRVSKVFNELTHQQKLRICEIIINLGTKLKEHVNAR